MRKILFSFLSVYLWHGDEHGPLLILLADVGQPAEDHHAHNHHQHQQSKLLVAAQQVYEWVAGSSPSWGGGPKNIFATDCNLKTTGSMLKTPASPQLCDVISRKTTDSTRNVHLPQPHQTINCVWCDLPCSVTYMKENKCKKSGISPPNLWKKSYNWLSCSQNLSPTLGDKVDYGIGLLYRPASWRSLADHGTTIQCYNRLYPFSKGLRNGPLHCQKIW